MGRISRGWRLVRASWEILKQERSLLVLPVVSFVLLAAAGSGLWFLGWDGVATGREPTTGEYVQLGIFYFVASFIAVYFNAVVVGVATLRLRGEDPTLGDGFRLANSKLGKIASWAAVSATVGIILRSLEERFGVIGSIAVRLVGAAWGVITFFVVPVVLYEPMGVFPAIKRSAQIFKQRWGEQFVGSGSIALIVFLVAIPLVAIGVAIAMVAPPVGVAVIILSVGALISVSSVLSGIFNAALYRFATTGEASGAFSEQDLGASFRPKRG